MIYANTLVAIRPDIALTHLLGCYGLDLSGSTSISSMPAASISSAAVRLRCSHSPHCHGAALFMDIVMDRATARQKAVSLIEQHYFSDGMVVDEAVETRVSWVFSTHGIDGEMVLGNIPIVVCKTTGKARFLRCATVEFTRKNMVSYLRRLWNRLVKY